LRGERGEAIVGNIGNNQVLRRGDSDVACAVGVGQTSHLEKLLRCDPTHWHRKPNSAAPPLLLRKNAQMIRRFERPGIRPGWEQRPTQPTHQLLSESRNPPVVDEKGEPRPRAHRSRSMVAEDQYDG